MLIQSTKWQSMNHSMYHAMKKSCGIVQEKNCRRGRNGQSHHKTNCKWCGANGADCARR